MIRSRVILLVWALTTSLSWMIPASAAPETPPAEPDSGAVVCTPGVYPVPPETCQASGPSPYLTELAAFGLTLPAGPLPATKPDPALGEIPFRYFHVISEEPVAIGSAPGDVGGSQLLFPGFVYIGYVDQVDAGGIYYLLESGGWVLGRGERVGEIPSFQGLQFRFTPRSSFGWTFEDIPIKSKPGYSTPDTGRRLQPFSIVQIYASQTAEEADWNRVGPDEWVEARKVAQVTVDTSSPPGSNGTRRWIDINLLEQTLAVYDDHRLVYATMISSGVEPFWTRPGTYQIYRKVESETMRNNDPSDFYYLDNVPWTMYFDGPRALHGAYWRTRFGYPQSHGCINLSVGDSHWLFDWAHTNDWVYIHDPSGRTPTDPALYTGGAY